MDEDDAEDVIFEDSPLYHHLKDMGYHDFETAQKSETVAREMDNTVDDKSNRGYYKDILSYSKSWLELRCQNILKEINPPQNDLADNIFKIISSSNILQEQDRALLEELIQQSTDNTRSSRNTTQFGLNNFFNTRAIGMAFAVLSVSYMLAFMTYLNVAACQVVTFILCFIYLLFAIFLWIFKSVLNSKSSKLISHTQELIKSAERLKDFTRKGIRIIQEAELIARGFTLISIQATTQRLEGSVSLPVRAAEKQCPELRESIFLFVRKCFTCYRNATCQLLQLFPVHKDIDMSSHYLACVKLEDLGPIFTTELMDGQNSLLEDFPDFTSVSSLKSLIQVMELQQSEFFRRFGLSLVHQPASNKSVILLDVFQTHSKLEHLISYVINPIINAITGLQRLQLYYKHLGIKNASNVEKYVEKTTSNKYLRPLEIAVHSLQLHLQAAVIRVQDLETQIEGAIGLNELSEAQTESFTMELCEVQSELIASTVCLDESIERLLNTREKEEPKGAPTETKPVGVLLQIQKSPPIPIFDMGDPVIEDQVFEAVATHIDNDSNREKDDFWLSDEKKSKKKSKESSANLLKELKSVLVDKAEEHRQREEKAKAKLSDSELKQEEDMSSSNLTANTLTLSSSSKSEDSTERSTSTIEDLPVQSMCSSEVPGKSDSDSTGSIEIIHADSPLDEKLLDFLEAEHDSASTTESIEACGDSPMVETGSEVQSFSTTSGFNFASLIASQVAQRSLLLGQEQQIFSAEAEETFEGSEDEN